MRADTALYEFMMNYPSPCMYFDNKGMCVKRNGHSDEFFNHWNLRCECLEDIRSIIGTDLKTSGKALLNIGCIEYALIPVKNGHLFLFNSRNISKNEFMPFGIFIVDACGKIIDYNPRCKDILGHVPGTIKSFSFLKGRHLDNGMRLHSGDWCMSKALKGITQEEELIDIVRNGEKITIAMSSYPVKDVQERVIGSVTYIQDVSKYREYEMQAVEAKHKTEVCLKNIVKMISRVSPKKDISEIKTAVEVAYAVHQIEIGAFPSETIDITCLLDAAGYECERSLKNGTTVLCRLEGTRLISGNSHLKDAFKSIIKNIGEKRECDIVIDIKDYCEHGREYHRIEIKDEFAEISGDKLGLINCCNHRDYELSMASRVIQNFGGRVWAEAYSKDKDNYSKFIIILPSIFCASVTKTDSDVEGFA